MNYSLSALAALLACASLALPGTRASISVSIDKLDASDGFPIPPSNLVAVDIGVTLTADDAFFGVGIRGLPANGAQIHYGYDPNSGTLLRSAPGTNNRFVTFFSQPRPRNNDNRFDGRGYISAGNSFCGGNPTPDFTPAELNAFAESPVAPDGLSGYVLRVVIDLSAVDDPAFRQDSENIVVAAEPPPDSVTLFQSVCPDFGDGVMVASEDDLIDPTYFDFGIYGVIPEPSTGCLLAVSALMIIWRRP